MLHLEGSGSFRQVLAGALCGHRSRKGLESPFLGPSRQLFQDITRLCPELDCAVLLLCVRFTRNREWGRFPVWGGSGSSHGEAIVKPTALLVPQVASPQLTGPFLGLNPAS